MFSIQITLFQELSKRQNKHKSQEKQAEAISHYIHLTDAFVPSDLFFFPPYMSGAMSKVSCLRTQIPGARDPYHLSHRCMFTSLRAEPLGLNGERK